MAGSGMEQVLAIILTKEAAKVAVVEPNYQKERKRLS